VSGDDTGAVFKRQEMAWAARVQAVLWRQTVNRRTAQKWAVFFDECHFTGGCFRVLTVWLKLWREKQWLAASLTAAGVTAKTARRICGGGGGGDIGKQSKYPGNGM